MKRYRKLEKLQRAGRAGLPRAHGGMAGPVRDVMERLAKLALDPDVPDAEFVAALEAAAAAMPGHLQPAGHAALADLLAGYMGAAMQDGIEAGLDGMPEREVQA